MRPFDIDEVRRAVGVLNADLPTSPEAFDVQLKSVDWIVRQAPLWLERLLERLDKAESRVAELEGDGDQLNLLRKLASGKGGARTGALKRAGYLTWEVTPAGRAALEESGR